MQSLNEFLESAQGGEFNFGSNVHGFYDVNDPDGEITMISHNVEEFTYKCLEDVYRHYVKEESVTYRYSMLVGEWYDDDTFHTDCPDFEEPMKRLLPVRESDESEVWSDPVEVTCNYSNRITPVHFKGEIFDDGKN
ncbi:MAG: hypothetical protein CL840_14895 [Crocinitomicaceae bacterium]|jgi:hypothetical protein|nr:hypothetical protein [Crocinitomicaceae bacterium]|tara:strand:+ start:149015 stop:149422 length:408 start_codon:yes stop_codon:yes gene_type:complete